MFFIQATLKVQGESYRQERKLRKSEFSLFIVFYFYRYFKANDMNNEKNHVSVRFGVGFVAAMALHVREGSSFLNICTTFCMMC